MTRFLLAGVCVSFAAATATAQTDQVRTTSGNVAGQVTASSPISVTVTRGSTEKKVPLVDITAVQFAEEPSELRQARLNYRNGGYKVALDKLQQIDAAAIDNAFVTADIAFHTAASQAKLALLGERTIADAGRQLERFLNENRKSYHWLAGTELMGDLFVAAKRYDQAEGRYKKLAQAPFPQYKIRAGVLLGEVSQAKEDHATAIKRFDAVLSIDDDSANAGTPKLRARLGRAVSLAATGKLDDGVRLVQEVIRESDPEARRLNARAYNALGNCYREAGQAKEAAYAYLHVDLLYASVPEQHAEALYRLGSLLEEVGKPQEARDARQTLQKQYASSRWAKL
ncbi:MAG: tetratricopeptide repeat protein [Planctomycetota bacterium]